MSIKLILFCVEDSKIYSNFSVDTTQSSEGSNIIVWQPLSIQLNFLDVWVLHMRGRKTVRKYLIHSPYKPLVKTTWYKQPAYTARALFKSPSLQEATLKEVTCAIRKECEMQLPSPSLLRSSSIKSLLEFSPRDIQKELGAKAPVLLAVLKAAASSCRSEPTHSVVAMSAAVLLKSKSQNMCKLQAVVSSLLYAGHSSKKVFDCIALGITRYIARTHQRHSSTNAYGDSNYYDTLYTVVSEGLFVVLK